MVNWNTEDGSPTGDNFCIPIPFRDCGGVPEEDSCKDSTRLFDNSKTGCKWHDKKCVHKHESSDVECGDRDESECLLSDFSCELNAKKECVKAKSGLKDDGECEDVGLMFCREEDYDKCTNDATPKYMGSAINPAGGPATCRTNMKAKCSKVSDAGDCKSTKENPGCFWDDSDKCRESRCDDWRTKAGVRRAFREAAGRFTTIFLVVRKS